MLQVVNADGMIMALLSGDKVRILRKTAKQCAEYFEKPGRIAEFLKREPVEIFQP